MNHSIFLDTDIFFECFECPKFETIIEHALNLGYDLSTSISVLGQLPTTKVVGLHFNLIDPFGSMQSEGFTQMNDKANASDYILASKRYLDDWEIAVHFPNDYWRGERKPLSLGRG